jgi:D-arabinose 1-dehydrogenase-like Zn-dependent alcohol dehydrogenase
MAKMKVAVVPKAGADFEIVEWDIPEPGPGHVRIRVQASGVCHNDVLAKQGGWPGLVYPRVPGHEVAAVIDQAGPGVTQWKKGQRVGVGWRGRPLHWPAPPSPRPLRQSASRNGSRSARCRARG